MKEKPAIPVNAFFCNRLFSLWITMLKDYDETIEIMDIYCNSKEYRIIGDIIGYIRGPGTHQYNYYDNPLYNHQ